MRITHLVKLIDRTVHRDLQKQGGMSLLRGRMLSLICLVGILAGASLVISFHVSHQPLRRSLFVLLIMALAAVTLVMNRWIKRNPLLSAFALLGASIFTALDMMEQAQSMLAPGLVWYSVLILPTLLLCGRRLGLMTSVGILLVGFAALGMNWQHGAIAPYAGDASTGFSIMVMNLAVAHTVSLIGVSIYFYLLHESEKSHREQKQWIQRTGRMQELLQMSQRFALQTNGPLDLIGTALQNMEAMHRRTAPPRELASWLGSLEGSMRQLASVSKSFSLFSRPFLQDGLEPTSVNAVLQHVMIIYNPGPAQKPGSLQWQKLEPDIPIHTQTAKLVMLLICLLRAMRADGGTEPTLTAALDADSLQLTLRYRTAGAPDDTPQSANPALDPIYDAELIENLIQELCTELAVSRRDEQDRFYRMHHIRLSVSGSSKPLPLAG